MPLKRNRTFNIIVEQGYDGYLVSSVIELPGCHTQAKTYDKLLERTREAIELFLDENEEFELSGKFLSLQQITV
jgi:predicted RNase H-like HicB family nuclease